MDRKNIKAMLQDAVERKRRMKEDEDFGKFASEISREIAGKISPDEVTSAVIDKLSKSIEPVLERLLEKDRISSADIANSISQIQVTAPEVDTQSISDAIYRAVSNIRFPEIKAPKVIIPEIKVPDIHIPPFTMPDRIMAGLDYNDAQPLPVIMMGRDGKPFQFSMGAGGGKADYLTIKGYAASAFTELMNADGRLRVSVETGGSGLTDNELRATAVPVSQVSGVVWSTAVIDIFGSTSASGVFNADNRLKVSVETGGSGLTDAELRATSVPVAQVSGVSWSTNVLNTVTVDGSGVTQPVSGTVAVSGITNSVAASIIDSSGVQYSGSNPLPISDAGGSLTVDGTFWQATQPVSAASLPLPTGAATAALQTQPGVDIGDVTINNASGASAVNIQDGGNSLTVDGTVAVSGITNTTSVVGDKASDVADDESNPIKIGGVARTANPSAVAAGDRVSFSADDLGRQVMRPVQVRDLTSTAYATLTNGTETSLFAGATSTYHDLIYVLASNNSTAAVGVDIRATTGGNVMMHLEVPANGVVGVSTPVPIPAGDVDASWTADLPDITGTTVYLSALFTKEV